MELGILFEWIYPIVPLIAVIGYGPQLLAVVKADDDLRGVSLLTWCIWLGTWSIAFGYSSISIGDLMLSVTAGINMVLHVTLIGTVYYKRMAYMRLKNMESIRPV